MKPQLYARLEDLKALVAQAESEHHDGNLGIVRIALRDVFHGERVFEIDMDSDIHERVLIG